MKKRGKTRFRRAGLKFVKGRAGANRIRLTRKLRAGKRLKPGLYRMTAVAVADGTKSARKRVRFRIRR